MKRKRAICPYCYGKAPLLRNKTFMRHYLICPGSWRPADETPKMLEWPFPPLFSNIVWANQRRSARLCGYTVLCGELMAYLGGGVFLPANLIEGVDLGGYWTTRITKDYRKLVEVENVITRYKLVE